ncbi:hypothetical protein M0R19_01880 [Candidatus Pacearchaeota archaeon]|nr:hypothetical protein [Candidatus Pacearchaeota archaeon]
MGFFGSKKKIVDWSAGYRADKKAAERTSSKTEEPASDLGFLGSFSNANSDNSSSNSDISWDNESSATVGDYQNKKQKLAKRLLDMTNKMEDMSNQIYHLKQRMEVIEKKLKISFD